MQDYIERMTRCGISVAEATQIYKSMVKEFGFDALEELIISFEKDCYVA